jgi:iron complex outermembrane receptor protein
MKSRVGLRGRLVRDLLATTAMLGAGLAPAVAQTAPAGTIQLDEITVTGERVERRVQDTGASVAVTRDAEIKARNQTNAIEIFERTPNVAIANDGRDVVIRGVPKAGLAANEDILTQNSGDVITTFLDGVPISTWAGATSLWDIGQVEIFRGAQTTTSGRGSLGGAVFLRSLDPTPQWSGSARAGYGSYGSSTFSGAVSGPLIPGILGLRLSIDRQITDGFIRNVTTNMQQNVDQHTTARGKLVYDPGTGTRVDLSFTHSDRTKGGGLASQAYFPRSFINLGNIPERLDKTIDVGSVSFRHELWNGWRLEGLTGLGFEDASRRLDGDSSALDLLRVKVDERTRQISQELRLVYADPTSRWSGFFGLYGRAFEREARNDIKGLLNVLTDIRTRTQTFAAFGEATYALTPGLRITAGGRLESDSYKTRFRTTGAQSSDDVVVPLPKVSLAYDFAPNVTGIGTVQRGYRAGGAGSSVLSATRYAYDPEYTWNYEAALRTRWLDNRLEINLNAFHVDWTDQQVINRLGGSPFDATITNAGRSESNGAELEARFKLTDEWTVFASGGLLNTRFKQFVSAGIDYSGKEFPFAAPYQLGAGFIYAHSSGFSLSADVNYLGASYSDIANTERDKNKARVLVNSTASYKWRNATASLFAKNLLDEKYTYVRATASGLVGPGQRRTIGGEVRVDF